ncbi:MAG: DUF4892 domain-containing protein [Gammaproteobacteria bacterium]|nr:DUF4892 domain-containing protein [Gammaproteobacteria bacterium]
MYKNIFLPLIFLVLAASQCMADATIPDADIKNSHDSELVGRLEGAFIVSFSEKDFDEAVFPLSELKWVKGKKDTRNNHFYKPDQAKTLEGKRTRIVYLNREGATPLEVIRTYEKDLEDEQAIELYSCKRDECGGSSTSNSGGGGGSMSLAIYLWPGENIKDGNFTNGSCAQKVSISDQRYVLLKLPESGIYVSVLSYQLGNGTYCGAIAGRTITVLDIVQVEQMKSTIVTVNSEEMASEISDTGRIALYGIQFDSDKADLKPGSKDTLDQISNLLTEDPELKLLIVGHTDSVGSYEFNLDLSQRRAASVVQSLSSDYGISNQRLFPVGVSFASPVASNKNEEGRAENRRVELVSF